MSDYELMIRWFLRDHPEHIPGVVRDSTPEKKGLCLDPNAALALMEWSLAKGLYHDRAKLEANIAAAKAKLAGEKT